MKLSEMNTKQLAEALCKIAEPVNEIVSSPDVAQVMQKLAGKEDNSFRYIGKMVALIIPVALDKHRDATFRIISALSGKSVAEIEQQPGLQTIRDARDIFDAELISFFMSSGDLGLREPPE